MATQKKMLEEVPLDHVRGLISERLAALGLDMAQVSRQLGRNHAYLQQYVRYNVPQKGLSEADRHRLAAIIKVTPGQLRVDAPASNPGFPTEKWPGEAGEEIPASNFTATPLPARPDRLHKVPLLGSGQAGADGVFEFNGETIDLKDRPPGLVGKTKIYCILVDGDSMSPAHNHGDLLFVDAARKPYPGRDAVIELHPEHEGGPQRAFIKRIVKMTTDYVELLEFKPKERTFRLARSKIKGLHLVLTNNEMY